VDLTVNQWGFASVAAFVIGFSKTGLPGLGILAVPLMAVAFGGRLSVGATLPMLILADCFAVHYYRGSADWGAIRRLAPWVVAGLIFGTWTLIELTHHRFARDPLSPAIGMIVLLMLGLGLLRGRLGEQLVPNSPVGTAFTGAVAGFTTMTSNAAGPVMSLYMAASGFGKDVLMGTSAWTFLIFNVSKVPLLAFVNALASDQPVISWTTLQMNLAVSPMLIAGALLGNRLLPHIPERLFLFLVQFLAAIAALRLLFV
jgi:hypothetical protein